MSLPSAALYRQRGQPPAPETASLLTRMSVPPSPARRTQIDMLVKSLLAAGLWTKLDALYLLAAHDAQAARLNLIPWTGTVTNLMPNSTMQGAVVGGAFPTGWAQIATSNGITRSVVGLGTINGLPYVDMRWAGTATSTYVDMAMSPTIAAATGERYTTSVMLALVGGSLAGLTGLNIVTYASPGNSDNATSGVIATLAGALQRFAVTRLLTLGGTTGLSPRLALAPSVGATIDITLRIAAPQLVRMDVPGNFIPTSGAAASQMQSLARFDLSAVNSPAFTVDRGYSGNGTTSYLDANANPSVDFSKASLNSATYGAWVSSETTSPNSVLGATVSSIPVVPRSDTNTTYCRVHSNVSLTVPGATTALGLTAGNRSAANALQLYRNGVSIGASTAASSAMTTELWVGRNVGTYYPGQVSAAFAGGTLSEDEHLALYSALRTYLMALGAAS
ncbi:hypothetical protein [Roseixanthobacter glucoisosaccharinicivorans]|uniref:hypothetical protein n=1 Tax=Roseixanthobacter glucoisosaccharinicivorans TaxID=3119923 RepID=UPI003726A939